MTKIRSFAIAMMTMTASAAWADKQPETPATPTAPTMPTMPTMPTTPATPASMPTSVSTASTLMPAETTSATKVNDQQKTDAKDAKKKEPGRGDFDAGGQVRLPNGPDETGKYATFNWVAVDMKGKYYLLDQVTVSGNVPLAIIHPKTVGMDGPETSMFGGFSGTLEARLPKMPKMPFLKYETEVGLTLTAAYMREGALLLSDKDFPAFTGDFQPGFVGGLLTKVKLSSLVDFKLTPSWAYQSGTMESLEAIQVPMSLVLKLGDVVKLAADTGVYTGDNYSIRGSNGGRVVLGGSLDVKLGKIIAHGGLGFASLLTGPAYPTVKDSLYVDLNVKFAK